MKQSAMGRLRDAARWRMAQYRRTRSIKKLRTSGGHYAEVLADALSRNSAALSPAVANWKLEIERIRSEMLACDESLAAWERPWLSRSSELKSRLEDQQGDQRDVSRDGMLISQAVLASKPAKWCSTLFELVYQLRPSIVVELGTNVGISGLYLAAAAKENGVTRVVTLEGSASKAMLAKHYFEQLDLTNQIDVVVGDFLETLPGILRQHGSAIDMAFIDGFHDGAATTDFHRQFSAVMRSGLLVYDDIRWSKGMKRAWDQIEASPEVSLAVDAGAVGFCALENTERARVRPRCHHVIA